MMKLDTLPEINSYLRKVGSNLIGFGQMWLEAKVTALSLDHALHQPYVLWDYVARSP